MNMASADVIRLIEKVHNVLYRGDKNSLQIYIMFYNLIKIM